MKTTLLTLSLLLSLSGLFAQSPAEFTKKADALYASGDYQESGEMYSKALESGEGSTTVFYNAACSWALAGDADKGIEYLTGAMEKGWTNVAHLKRDSDLNSLHEHPKWASVVDMAQSNLDAYEATLNKPLKDQLDRIYLKDQTIRQLHMEAEKKFGRDSDEMRYFWEVVNSQDRENEAEVEKLIQEHGWVGTSEVGGKANMTLWLVIQHAPLEVQAKYLPLLKESVKKGESSGSHLAMLEDRVLMRSGKPQIYGSQVVTDENGDWIVYEVEDPENINARRAEVGLGPIENYVKRYGITWGAE